ncbi:tRNA (N(6)-L-threonylcarbamoyladenosine(37)-C(2))-methylthiotransferase [Candidatus Woesearchaeota archaeon]|nr:tRNA (N(6)-L-threonylcarbamoyladenosine(37)-C(2))-methylthiotransferase [Candidatus Woesearchaeota archaeon]
MHKIFFFTQGCSNNVADTETMQGILQQDGYEIVKTAEQADLFVINSCTVKNATEKDFFRYLKTLPKKPLVIAGCIAQTDPEKLAGLSLLGTTQINNITDVVEQTLDGNKVVLIKKENNQRLNLPKIRKNPVVEIIPINRGCLGNCTFCKTKAARFNLQSFEKEAILQQVKTAISQSIKEIWLTSQDTAVYGLDIGLALPALLREILALDGAFMVRLGMGNPDHFKLYIDELTQIFLHPKMFKFLHIPMQAGDNDVLKAMKRDYTREEFSEIVQRLREKIPEITIATDIICGFPEETDEQFNETLKIIEQLKFDVINISRYSARPKTFAATLPQLAGGVIAERSRKITELFESQLPEINKKWIGWQGIVIIDDYGKEGTQTMLARTHTYKQVVVKGDFALGEMLHVKIVRVDEYSLYGEIL